MFSFSFFCIVLLTLVACVSVYYCIIVRVYDNLLLIYIYINYPCDSRTIE